MGNRTGDQTGGMTGAGNGLFLGADVGGTWVKFVLAGRDGAPLREGRVATDPGSAAATLTTLGAAVAAAGCGRDRLPPLAGVGLACAGIVDPHLGRLGRSPNLPGWEGSDLEAAVRLAFPGIPLALANDVNAALYGEALRGAGKGCGDLIMIALGTGVGGGVMVDGRLVLGAHCGAGEIGHMVLDPDGPACTCGGRGCLEAYAGSTALLRAARSLAASPMMQGNPLADLVASRGPTLETRDLALLALRPDADTAGLFAEAGRRLGQAVGNLVNLLDPDRVIIGGGVAQAGDLILEPCRRYAPTLILAEPARALPIVAAELGPRAAAVGAALLAQERDPGL